MRKPNIYPIVLAAGASSRLGFPKPLAPFGRKNALEIAVDNCSSLQEPVVVLGDQASKIRAAVPRSARVVVNRHWRSGQLSSLLAGLQRIPRNADFLVYPVDHPLLTPQLIRRLVAAFQKRTAKQKIVMPRFGRQAGHPVIFSAELRRELCAARTARKVVYRDRQRIKFVPIKEPAVCQDFDTPVSYYKCLREFHRRSR